MGERARLRRISAWPSGPVAVMWQRTCARRIAPVRYENGSGGRSPSCACNPRPVDGAAIEPGRRAGLQPAEAEAEPFQREREARRRRIADAPRRDLPLADVNEPAQEGAGGEHHLRSRDERAVPQRHAPHAGPGVRALLEYQVLDRALADREVGLCCERRLHGRAVERAVLLRPGPAHRRPLAAVEHAELDARLVGDAAHQPVERVHLAHQRAFGEPADGGVAGHRADGLALLGDEQGRRAHARGRRCRLAAGVAAPDHDDIETLAAHGRPPGRRPGPAPTNAAPYRADARARKAPTCRCRSRGRRGRAPPRRRPAR